MGNPYAPRKKSNAKAESAPQEEKNEDLKTPTEEQNTQKKSEDTEKPKLEVPEATMEGILDWVGEDKERAAAAIEHENAQSKPRKTLLSKLGDI